jgi:hypothetical protein
MFSSPIQPNLKRLKVISLHTHTGRGQVRDTTNLDVSVSTLFRVYCWRMPGRLCPSLTMDHSVTPFIFCLKSYVSLKIIVTCLYCVPSYAVLIYKVPTRRIHPRHGYDIFQRRGET